MTGQLSFNVSAKLGHDFSPGACGKITRALANRDSDKVSHAVWAIPFPYIVIDSGPWTDALVQHRLGRRSIRRMTSDNISIEAADNLIRAVAFSELIERPLRHHLTIRWPTRDWRLHHPTQQFVGKWLKRNLCGSFYVWAKEGTGGPHSHFLLHLGTWTGAHIRAAVVNKMRRMTGLPKLEKGAVQCRSVHSFGSAATHTAHRAAYLCKGGNSQVRMLLRLRKTELPHLRAGKRTGVSQSLGVTARNRYFGAP